MTYVTQEAGNRHTARHHQHETSALGSARPNRYTDPLHTASADRRRLFATEAILNGMPPHIAQLLLGHKDINVTMGYKAVYPQEAINGHRAFIARRRELRPSDEYRTPTDAEWDEFLGHFERRRLALGDCGRAYGTSCIHELSCLTEMILVTSPRRSGAQGVRVLTDGDWQESWLAAIAGVSPGMAASFQSRTVR